MTSPTNPTSPLRNSTSVEIYKSTPGPVQTVVEIAIVLIAICCVATFIACKASVAISSKITAVLLTTTLLSIPVIGWCALGFILFITVALIAHSRSSRSERPQHLNTPN